MDKKQDPIFSVSDFRVAYATMLVSAMIAAAVEHIEKCEMDFHMKGKTNVGKS